MGMVWRFLRSILVIVGVLTLLSVFGVGVFVWYVFTNDGEGVPDRYILAVDLSEEVLESGTSDPLGSFFGDGPIRLTDAAEAIRLAADDPRAEGLVMRLGSAGISLPGAQELSSAAAYFAATGKPSITESISLGDLGPANGDVLLASQTDQTTVNRLGTFGLSGFSFQVPFAAEALDRWGIETEVARRGDYKTAFDSFTHTGFSPAHREMMDGLADDLFDQLVSGVAEARGMDPARVADLIDQAPLTSEDAAEGGLVTLVTRLPMDEAELLNALLPSSGAEEDVSLIGIGPLLNEASDDDPQRPTIAIINAAGPITSIGGGGSGDVIDPSEMVPIILAAGEDEEIDALVLRIDSGGGSALGSELIGQALAEVSTTYDKPIIISMGRVAASGAYWIAAEADRILAQPATLTGSIGVIAGKPVLANLMADFGINWGTIERGRNASMWSPISPLSRSEADRLDFLIDDLYDRFLQRVSAGRGLPYEVIDQLAQGRVWTGRQAHGLGLVDRLGGLEEAIDEALAMLDAPADARAERVFLPESPGVFEELMNLGEATPLAATGLSDLAVSSLLPGADQPWLASWLWAAEEAATGRAPIALVMPPMRVEGF